MAESKARYPTGATAWHDVWDRIDSLEETMTIYEEKFKNTATKTELEKLRADIKDAELRVYTRLIVALGIYVPLVLAIFEFFL